MDRFTGYYRRILSNGVEHLAKADAETRLQTRTGINRKWGVVEESILYNREVFDEHMPFWGQVVLPDELAGDFTDYIMEASREGVIARLAKPCEWENRWARCLDRHKN